MVSWERSFGGVSKGCKGSMKILQLDRKIIGTRRIGTQHIQYRRPGKTDLSRCQLDVLWDGDRGKAILV